MPGPTCSRREAGGSRLLRQSHPRIRTVTYRRAAPRPVDERHPQNPERVTQRRRFHRASISREDAMGRSRTRNVAKHKWLLNRHFAHFLRSANTPASLITRRSRVQIPPPLVEAGVSSTLTGFLPFWSQSKSTNGSEEPSRCDDREGCPWVDSWSNGAGRVGYTTLSSYYGQRNAKPRRA